MRLLLTHLILIIAINLHAQEQNWSPAERKNYQTIKSLCEYYEHNTYDSTHRDHVFKNYIYFDNILNDENEQRKQTRLQKFDGLFSLLLHYVDSVGLQNLDAKPTRFFESHKAYFAQFEQEEMRAAVPRCLTYFDKRKPETPLGTLIFEEKTNKMFAWIVLSQAGYHYFLTFNLL